MRSSPAKVFRACPSSARQRGQQINCGLSSPLKKLHLLQVKHEPLPIFPVVGRLVVKDRDIVVPHNFRGSLGGTIRGG